MTALSSPSPAALRSTVRQPPIGVLDALLSSGAIGEREHAGGLAYRGVRRRWEEAERTPVAALSDAAHAALRRRHAALVDAAGFDRFALDRLCLGEEAPLRCEVGRVREALGRVAA